MEEISEDGRGITQEVEVGVMVETGEILVETTETILASIHNLYK